MRLYTDHRFNTDTDYCEDWGHDLSTGAVFERRQHADVGANGRAVLKAAAWEPPGEPTSDEHPLVLTTGRTVYQFHTRTKTARAPELDAAAPEAWCCAPCSEWPAAEGRYPWADGCKRKRWVCTSASAGSGSAVRPNGGG